jgi:hypothetical protein
MKLMELNWKSFEGKTNGKWHCLHSAKTKYATCAIYETKDSIILGINGYRFEHKSVEEAKKDAVYRLENNAGIYLTIF